MPPALLFVLYVCVALAPIGLAWWSGLPARPFRDDLSSALALAGFAMLLMEFVLSGRFRPISGRIGMDATMRFHQRVARPVTVLLLLHPFLYTLPFDRAPPWDASRQLALDLPGGALLTGIGAWLLLGALVIAAIARDGLPWRYETWRLSHGLGAALLAGLGAHHALAAGRYSARPELAALWLALLALALLTLATVYVLRPLLLLRRPYRVRSVRRVALRIWEVVVEPERGKALAFQAGQFVWLRLGRSPFSLCEHPFSIASAPAEGRSVAFVVKEAGDFTNRIGDVPPGARAYLDGPHGNLVLAGRKGKGIVFLAGGVGVAPILSMLRQLRAAGEARPLRLLYGNHVREQILYADELEAMGRALDLKTVHILAEPPPGWAGETGQIDAAAVRRHCGRPDRAAWLYVVCGPPAMIAAVEDALRRMGVPARQILSEKFAYA